MLKQEINKLSSLLSIPKIVVILSHRNPDGDAIGSSIALAGYLKMQGHTVKIIFPSEYPVVYQYFRDIRNVYIADLHPEQSIIGIRKADLIFCLDFNSLDRIDKLGPLVLESNAFKVLIDHHIDPEPFADLIFSDLKASSTSELVFEMIEELGDVQKIDKNIAEALFTGILTDTGSFKYSATPKTYRIAAHLKEAGADDYWLQNKIYNSLTEKQLRLLGHCLANRMEVLSAYKTGLIYLTKQDYEDFKISRGDTEGIVNYILMMRHVRIAAFITEQSQYIKISLRSKGNISVQELARDYFHGGGHRNASGGYIKQNLEETIRYFKQIIPEFLLKKGVIK
jgi:phosphoesterase RecJ-like protein